MSNTITPQERDILLDMRGVTSSFEEKLAATVVLALDKLDPEELGEIIDPALAERIKGWKE